MMPIVWFYVALVGVLWGLLWYVETQRRNRKKVRGCLQLQPVSADKLWSLMVMYPLLEVIEVQASSQASPVLIRGAVRVSLPDLKTYLQNADRGHSFAFYSATPSAISWDTVDCVVCAAGLRKGYVLQGEIELWRKSRLPLDVAGQSPTLSAS